MEKLGQRIRDIYYTTRKKGILTIDFVVTCVNGSDQPHFNFTVLRFGTSIFICKAIKYCESRPF